MPNNPSIVLKQFNSKHECEKASNSCIDKAYHAAERHFNPDSADCISRDATDFYGNLINQTITTSALDALRTLCSITGQKDCFKKLNDKIFYCHKYLKEKFVHELYDSADYYQMYDINYFRNQAEIEKHDNRIYSEGFFKRLETAVSDRIQYSISDVYTPIAEMEKDMNDHAAVFFNVAYREYMNFVSEIEELLDQIGEGFPEFTQDESITSYIERCCIIKRMAIS